MELTINNLIKIILGLLVVVAVIYGVYRIFNSSILGVFGGISNPEKLFLGILK